MLELLHWTRAPAKRSERQTQHWHHKMMSTKPTEVLFIFLAHILVYSRANDTHPTTMVIGRRQSHQIATTNGHVPQFSTDLPGKSGHRILMVVNYHWSNYSSLDFVQNVYIPFFRKNYNHQVDVVIYGPDADGIVKSNYLNQNGFYSYQTLTVAYRESPKIYDGYMLINDDCFVNPFFFNHHNLSQILVQKNQLLLYKQRWFWARTLNDRNISFWNAAVSTMRAACSQKRYPMCKELRKRRDRAISLRKGWSDFFYYPKELMEEYVKFGDMCYANRSFLEICMPTFAANYDYYVLPMCSKLTKKNFLRCGNVHPIKYGASFVENREIMAKWFTFLQNRKKLFTQRNIIRKGKFQY